MKIYDVIKSAEEVYIEEIKKSSGYPGICWCLKVAATKGMDFKEKNKKGHPTYNDLVTNIPEFNPDFLGATEIVFIPGLDFWWNINDTKSRLNAFCILKNIYKQTNKEFIY